MDVITVPAWMLCVNGWSRGEGYYASGMDALRERMESGFHVIRVPAWMLCVNAWSPGGVIRVPA